MVQRTCFSFKLSTAYKKVKNEDKTGKVPVSEISWKRERNLIFQLFTIKNVLGEKQSYP